MPDTNMEHEIQRLVDEIPAVDVDDPGANNMGQAGELAAQAVREIFAEAAKRTLAVGKLAMDMAMQIDQQCKEEADRLIAHGDERAKELTGHFQRTQSAAADLKKIK